ncbi:sigma-70 family RNA polymerase sigma factor [Candidatus Poribacteria bacterium]|nr:sigma-70 family RNA polymerase sigma factor [Candidatus Poribacteria bacterium]
MAQQSNNDEELVQRIKQGDAQALDALVQNYLSKTYNRVRCLVPEADAEDVTQEIFLALVRSIDHFDGRSAFSTWFYRIIMNKVADHYRAVSRREKGEEEFAAARERSVDSWSQEDAERSSCVAYAKTQRFVHTDYAYWQLHQLWRRRER